MTPLSLGKHAFCETRFLHHPFCAWVGPRGDAWEWHVCRYDLYIAGYERPGGIRP